MKNTAKIQVFEPEEWKRLLPHKRTDIPPTNRMLDVHEVADKIGSSKSTIYRMMNDNIFPLGKEFGARNRRWPENQIDDWMNHKEGN